MLQFLKKYRFFGVLIFILLAILVTNIIQGLKTNQKLPIYQPSQIDSQLVDTSIQSVSNSHKIADFALYNQNGKIISQADYENKIYVADFFFTTCQTICIPMKLNMLKIQEQIKDNDRIMLLSHTVTPEIDDVAQLKKFATEQGILDNKWNLLTGDKKQIYDLARKSYLVAKDNEFKEYDLIHTENFVLVDTKKRIRGYYDGTDDKEIKRLLEDLKILEEESFGEKL